MGRFKLGKKRRRVMYTIGQFKKDLASLEERELVSDETTITVWQDNTLCSAEGISWHGRSIAVCDVLTLSDNPLATYKEED